MKSGLEKVFSPYGIKLQVAFTPPNLGRQRLCDLVRIWRPVGVVAAVSDISVVGVDLPVVFLSVEHAGGGHDQILDDSAEIGRIAAKELVSIGNAALAYVAHPGNFFWIGERRRAFQKAARSEGMRVAVHRLGSLRMDDEGLVDELCDFISALPKPCGVFAANDEIASMVVAVARRLGLHVPEDVSVIGVDDNPTFVENGQVHMTSIVPDWKGEGEAAGRQMLNRLGAAASGEVLRPSCVRVPPLGLVRRASTRRMMRVGNTIARKALAFIRDHATSGISSADVVAHLGCSKSLANLRFREATGHSMLFEIQRIRFEKAKELLATGHKDASVVAAQCGYSSPSFFRREFKARTGRTFR